MYKHKIQKVSENKPPFSSPVFQLPNSLSLETTTIINCLNIFAEIY